MFKMFIFGAIVASYMYQLTGVKSKLLFINEAICL